jgi:hypothetical protein
LGNERYPGLAWYNVQFLLEDASSTFDVLIILDCCHAAGAVLKASNGTMEVFAGCGREATPLAPGRSSGSPFTQTLIKHLRRFAAAPQGVLIGELHLDMSCDEVLAGQSPNHVVLKGRQKPIVLKPLDISGKGTSQTTANPLGKQSLQALLAVSFEGDALPAVEEFVYWLASQ